MILAICTLAAWAQETTSPWSAEVSGHLKAFGVVTAPVDHLLFADLSAISEDELTAAVVEGVVTGDWAAVDGIRLPKPTATGQGITNARLNVVVRYGDMLRLEAAHMVSSVVAPPGTGLSTSGFGSGVLVDAPEAVDLTWQALDGGNHTLIGRTDRLALKATAGQVDVTLGRQPVTFGSGMFFAPLDLVNPFFPTTIDTEYKPGIDALRVDTYIGGTGRISAVGAYAGDWAADGMSGALYGQATAAVTDLGLFVGWIRGDAVVGATTMTSVGPVALHADGAVTVPVETEEEPFFRGVLGADYRPTGTTTLSGEAYVQTLGTTDPDRYLEQLSSDRFARGELFTVGVAYLGLAVAQEITPTVMGSLAVLTNPVDPSALVIPNVSASIGDNTAIAVGAYAGVGARPEVVGLSAVFATDGSPLDGAALSRAMGIRSEFGLYPVTAFTQLRTYF
ncbi:MAG: hypothetical protein ACI8PZ_005233 [Myxococcota bacterium]